MKKMIVMVGTILPLYAIMVFPSYAQVINACYQRTNGNLRIVSSSTDCRSSEVAISWNIVGPEGAPGSIDLSKIYIAQCAPPYATGFCQCENEGEIALSASAGCAEPSQVLTYVMRDSANPTRAWVALCKDLVNLGEYPAPDHFSVTCLRP
jgi:hypothetical protein